VPHDYPCTVDGCDRPVRGASICSTCEATLERDLAETGAYVDELTTSLARLSRMGERNGARSSEKPLPYDTRASEALSIMRSTLVGWVRTAVEEDQAHWPKDTPHAMAALLLARLPWIRTHPAAAEAVDEIGACLTLARRTVDRPVEGWYAGPCQADHEGGECPAHLYARPGAAQVSCRTCQTIHDVAQRQEWLRKSLEDHLATAREITGLCQYMLGEFVTGAMIRGYVHRGSVGAHGTKVDGRGKSVPLYRMGDVFSAAAEARLDPKAARKAARDAAEDDAA
jgi:hypothetical protein